MANVPDASTFSQRWVAAWNARDLEAVLAHFHEEVVFTSPVAARLLPQTGGVLRGKQALRTYWREGLSGIRRSRRRRAAPRQRTTAEANCRTRPIR